MHNVTDETNILYFSIFYVYISSRALKTYKYVVKLYHIDMSFKPWAFVSELSEKGNIAQVKYWQCNEKRKIERERERKSERDENMGERKTFVALLEKIREYICCSKIRG